MSDTAATSRPRKRVRTGCRTCRTRRRKCDEGKPVCHNCKSKNLDCQYGPKFTFVQSKRATIGTGETVQHDGSAQHQFVAASQTSTTGQNVRTSSNEEVNEEQHNGQAETNHDQQTHQSNPQDDTTDQIVTNELESDGLNFNDPGDLGFTTAQNAGTNDPYTATAENSLSTNIVQHHTEQENIPDWNPATSVHPSNTTPATVVIDFGRSPNAGHNPISSVMQEQSEMELVCYYRYKIATLLDLGVGALYWGIEALLDFKTSSKIYNAVLAFARCHKNRTTASSEHSHTPVHNDHNDHNLNGKEDAIAQILTLWTEALRHPPETWCKIVLEANAHIADTVFSSEHQLLLSRIVLAARLLAPIGSQLPDLNSPFHRNPLQAHDSPDLAAPQAQLKHALTLLEHSLSFLPGNERTLVLREMPLLAAWQACWHESQMWFATRSEEMEEIFGLSNPNLSQTRNEANNDSGLPIIVFSSGCAMVANIVHHLTSMLLLQHKPRLVKPGAGHISSTSPTWHMQRIIGIAVMSSDLEVWDPTLVAALILAARRLSHRKQLSMVVDTLKRAAKVSGMQLDEEMRKVDQMFDFG